MDIAIRQPFHGSHPITFPFGARPQEESIQEKFKSLGLGGHHGVDYMLPSDTPIVACDDGIVIQSGGNDDWGISITLKHNWGESICAHLSNVAVDVGKEVKRGDIIGSSGESGVVTGPHLHFGIKPNDAELNNGYFGFIDPTPYIKYSDE